MRLPNRFATLNKYFQGELAHSKVIESCPILDLMSEPDQHREFLCGGSIDSGYSSINGFHINRHTSIMTQLKRFSLIFIGLAGIASAQLTTINGSDQQSASRTTLNNNFTYLNGLITAIGGKVLVGSGAPTSTCNLANVGVYLRNDAGAVAATLYTCGKNGASTYAWEGPYILTAGGGGGGGGAPSAIPFNVSKASSTTLSLGTDCSITTCKIGNGFTTNQIVAAATWTVTNGGTGNVYVYQDGSSGLITVGMASALTGTCSAGCSIASNVVQYPADSVRLFVWHVSSGTVDAAAVSDDRSFLTGYPVITNGPGITTSQSGNVQTISAAYLPVVGVNAVASSASPAFNLALGDIQTITALANNATMSVSNGVADQQYTFIICQDATGSRTFTWPAAFKGTFAIDSGANNCTTESFISKDGTTFYAIPSPLTSGGGSGTVTSIVGGTGLTGGTITTTGTFAVQTTLISQKFFGTAAPGSVAFNLPGDSFTDTTNHNQYVCNAPSGTAAPACTSVAAAGWLQVNSGGSPAFSSITGATNTQPLVIGTGGSLTVSGSGTNNATSLGGVVAANYALLASPTFTGAPTAPAYNATTATTGYQISGVSVLFQAGNYLDFSSLTTNAKIRLGNVADPTTYYTNTSHAWQDLAGAGLGVLWKDGMGTQPATFSTLTACSVSGEEGYMKAVTDSTTATWGATITGSGSNHVLAYCDGTNWTVAGK